MFGEQYGHEEKSNNGECIIDVEEGKAWRMKWAVTIIGENHKVRTEVFEAVDDDELSEKINDSDFNPGKEKIHSIERIYA